MKILLIFALFLLTGAVQGSNVFGFSGGSVIMVSDLRWNPNHTKYICKMSPTGCKDLIRFNSQSPHVQYKRFLLYKNTGGSFLVLIRKLKPQDAGIYIFGVENETTYAVNLNVQNETSCGVPKLMNAFLGQNISLSCKYPAEYERNTKYIITLDDEAYVKPIIDTQTISENSRFSISDDRSAKVLSVSIGGVAESDGTFYLFGVYRKEGAVGYYSYFTEIQLHVTGTHTTTDAAPRGNPCSAEYSSSYAIIGVCVCVALFLIGAFTVIIYKLRYKRTHNSISFRNFSEEETQ